MGNENNRKIYHGFREGEERNKERKKKEKRMNDLEGSFISLYELPSGVE